MELSSCWLCGNELTKTREHIIPKSMGGKKMVVGFICVDCNSRTGKDWDAAVHRFRSWPFHLDPNLHVNPQQGKTNPCQYYRYRPERIFGTRLSDAFGAQPAGQNPR